jgi:hypothetical protein
MTGNRIPRGPSGPNVEITEAPPVPTPEPTPAPAPRRRPASPPPRDPAFQDFIDRLESDTPPQDIEPYKAPPPPPPLPSGKAGLAPTPKPSEEEELNFGGGVVPLLELEEEMYPTSSTPSDLEIFNKMLEEEGKIESPAPPPAPIPRAADLAPESSPTDPVITMTDVEIAEDEDPDVYRKALDYWKVSPNKDIAKNPPAYFAGKPEGKRALPGEGQKEMVRRYLIEMEKDKRSKAEKSTEESYLRYRDRPPINPDLARQSEGQSQAFFQQVSKTDAYIEQMDPTPDEKKEIFDSYEANKANMGIMSDRDVSDYYIQKLNELRLAPKSTPKTPSEDSQGSLPKTRQQRSASYALNIIQKGKDLASKPEKLARLAKTNLPEHERSKKIPEHIALVDKLYDINLSKGDVYKSTYSEIARVYEKQPKLRDAALEYLVAKNLMFGNIS